MGQNGSKPLKVAGSGDVQGILDIDYRTDYVHCPEWGEGMHVRVRELSAYGRLRIWGRDSQLDEFEEMTVMMLEGCIDEDGLPLFDEEEIEALAKRSGAPMMRVTNAIIRLTVRPASNQEDGEGIVDHELEAAKKD